jgi:transcriptional regulator with XRE-family HTH domain
MTPLQLRMGRAALELTPAELAEEAEVPSSEIVRYERGGGIASAAYVAALRHVLEAAGVVFSGVDGARLAATTGK